MKKIKMIDVLYYYILILFFLPNDIFEMTSLYTFITPKLIHYKLYTIPFSALYIPIIIIGIYLYLVKRDKQISNILLFLLVLLMKDGIIALLKDNFIFMSNSYELYLQYILSFSMMYIVFYRNKNMNNIYKFLEIFMIINILGLLVSIFTGIGTGIYGFEKRYHAPNITQGETAFLLGIFSIYLVYVKKPKYRYLHLVLMLLLILATGSRKDIIYVLIISSYDIVKNVLKVCSKGEFKIGKYSNLVVISILMLCTIIFTFDLIPSTLLEKLDFERTFSMLYSILTQGTDAIFSDYSGRGRIMSIETWIEVMKENPFGVSFSFFDSQLYMYKAGYPTFVHITLLYYVMVMGWLAIVPAYKYMYIFIKLFKYRDNFAYVVLYFIVYNIISGGALLDFKVLIIYIYILWVGEKRILLMKNEQEK